MADFDAVFTDEGLCYGVRPEVLHSTEAGGPVGGLYTAWNIESYERLTGSATDGMSVIVHDRDDVPYAGGRSITIAAGFETSIALRHVSANMDEVRSLNDQDGSPMCEREPERPLSYYDVGAGTVAE